ncbi:MAG TPA: hypothetical protein VNN81_02075 [Bradyrhizobium sp.]|nr:hypothetical protein [Bradyrhizobium sp.]
MSSTSTKIAIAILAVVAAAPAASFAQFARNAGSAAAGNVPISGIAQGPANAGGMNNVTVDPSGVGNAARVAPAAAAHKRPGDSEVQMITNRVRDLGRP